jgi:hypothetical protein
VSVLVIAVLAIATSSQHGEEPPGPSARNAFYVALTFVKDRLKAPSTADFCSFDDAQVRRLPDRSYRVAGHVDAENSFGAKLRIRWAVRVRHVKGDSWERMSPVLILNGRE